MGVILIMVEVNVDYSYMVIIEWKVASSISISSISDRRQHFCLSVRPSIASIHISRYSEYSQRQKSFSISYVQLRQESGNAGRRTVWPSMSAQLESSPCHPQSSPPSLASPRPCWPRRSPYVDLTLRIRGGENPCGLSCSFEIWQAIGRCVAAPHGQLCNPAGVWIDPDNHSTSSFRPPYRGRKAHFRQDAGNTADWLIYMSP